jgi:CBS domain-containing protein
MKVSSLIAGKTALTIKPDQSFGELVESLKTHKIGAMVVSGDGKKISGIASERDVVRHLSSSFDNLKPLKVKDIMTKDVFTCDVHATVAELMNLMTNMRIRHIPVVDDQGSLISIVSIGDVVKARIDEIDEERKALADYIAT